jgi:hypothetical protein
MAQTIPSGVPSQIIAGDTVVFDVSLGDWNNSEGDISVVFNKLDGTDTASATTSSEVADQGSGWRVTLDNTFTTAMDAGDWKALVFFTTTAGARYFQSESRVAVTANFATAAVDDRSHVEAVLEALEARILGRAAADKFYASISIGDRSVSELTIEECIRWRSVYKHELTRIKRAERVANGLGHKGQIRTRF